MRKIIISIITLGFIFSTGCSSFVEDQNISPNDPLDVAPNNILPSVEVATFVNYTGNLARSAGVLTQQFTGTQFQYLDLNSYDIKESTYDNEFQTIYSTALEDCHNIIKKTKGAENSSPHYTGIARVLLAMNLALLTDLFGDVPYTEAFRGVDNESPAFNTQQELYAIIQANLDSAIADFAVPEEENIVLPGEDDYIHGGDVAAWTTTAWILKARYANRLSKKGIISDASILSWLENAYENPVNAYAKFGENGSEQNQWYAFNNERNGYLYLSESFVNLLKDLNDPRLEVYVAEDGNKGYSGTPITETSEASYVGEKYSDITAPLPLVTISEAKFIEAEVALRSGDPLRAQMAYEEGITSSLEENEVESSEEYLALHGVLTPGSELEDIITQKYIAMYTQVEPYNDFRRTGFPILTPNPEGLITAIPQRFPLAQSERLYNQNGANYVFPLTKPVWWAE